MGGTIFRIRPISVLDEVEMWMASMAAVRMGVMENARPFSLEIKRLFSVQIEGKKCESSAIRCNCNSKGVVTGESN